MSDHTKATILKCLAKLSICLFAIGVISILVGVVMVFIHDSPPALPFMLGGAIGAIVFFNIHKAMLYKAEVIEGHYSTMGEAKEADERGTRELETEIIRRARIQSQQEEQRKIEIEAAQHPQCPACHGHNTQRISTTKRVVSTSLVGLASSTIGKQYECLDCQHKW